MIARNPDGTINVTGASYSLVIRGHIIDVVINGVAFASLDVRCAVNVTNSDYSITVEDERTLPILDSVAEQKGEAVFTWKNRSSLWEKEYILTCTYLRFRFAVKVKGKGRIDSVNYFSGNMAQPGFGSGYEFSYGFNPCKSWYDTEDYYFKASTECCRWSVLMVPPMFCYAFRCEGLGEQLALGLAAQQGEHNFHSFSYHLSPAYNWKSGFYLTTDQHGHTEVDGEWTAPCIIGYSAADEFEAMRKYSEYYFASGIAKTKIASVVPKFWHGPLVCGWIEQGAYAMTDEKHRSGFDLACEEVYENIVCLLKKNDLHPAAVIIDDKWMTHYATDVADPGKWPDLRAYVDRRHAEGINTILWFKLWDPDGWDKELCVTADNGEVRIDPSHPKFIENLDQAIYRIFSSDKGCYDCDGLKLDYAFIIPIGRKFKTYSGKYGVELLYDMMERIYKKAKEVKPTALINCSPCHPYFAHICDQARLHDYEPKNRNNLEDLSMRGRLFSLAMPGVLLDTDNSGFITRRDTMRWQLNQHMIGVPDLYAISPTPALDINSDDLGAIAEMWREYSAKIDAMYDTK